MVITFKITKVLIFRECWITDFEFKHLINQQILKYSFPFLLQIYLKNFPVQWQRKIFICQVLYFHCRYDLLPFYSRLTATLYPCMPDVANDLVQLVKGDFRWHVSTWFCIAISRIFIPQEFCVIYYRMLVKQYIRQNIVLHYSFFYSISWDTIKFMTNRILDYSCWLVNCNLTLIKIFVFEFSN